MSKLAFIDTETTGLDPDRHEVWEVGLIIREDVDYGGPARTETEYLWQLPVNVGDADTIALNIGQWNERRWADLDELAPDGPTVKAIVNGGGINANEPPHYVVPHDQMWIWARQFQQLTWGAHVVGAVPSFDEERLRKLLRRLDSCPGWHYHIIDVETLVVGALAQLDTSHAPVAAARIGDFRSLPWKSEDLSRAIGVDPEQFDKHTALGDARWARALYDKVMGGRA